MSEATIEALPCCGLFMGSAESPKMFAKACERPSLSGSRATEQLSKELKAVGMDGKELGISLVSFADDVFRNLVWDGDDEGEGVSQSAGRVRLGAGCGANVWRLGE